MTVDLTSFQFNVVMPIYSSSRNYLTPFSSVVQVSQAIKLPVLFFQAQSILQAILIFMVIRLCKNTLEVIVHKDLLTVASLDKE